MTKQFMKLDYQLTYLINNHKVNGVFKYDCVGYTIWFSKQELCDEISKFLDIDIPLETEVNVTKEQLQSVWKLLDGRKSLIGTYGDEYLNDWV